MTSAASEDRAAREGVTGLGRPLAVMSRHEFDTTFESRANG